MTPYRPAPRHARVFTLVPPPTPFWRRLSAWWRGVFKRRAVHALLREYTLMLRAFDRGAYCTWAEIGFDLFGPWFKDKPKLDGPYAWREFQRIRHDRLARGFYKTGTMA